MNTHRLYTLAHNLLKTLNQCSSEQQRIQTLMTVLSMSPVLKMQQAYPNLTPQESQCLMMAAHGKTAKETAQTLGIKPATVETHRKTIKQKLQCANLAHAVFLVLGGCRCQSQKP